LQAQVGNGMGSIININGVGINTFAYFSANVPGFEFSATNGNAMMKYNSMATSES
jgi:hypothetical protein